MMSLGVGALSWDVFAKRQMFDSGVQPYLHLPDNSRSLGKGKGSTFFPFQME